MAEIAEANNPTGQTTEKEEETENESKPPQFPLQFTYLKPTDELARHGIAKEEEEEAEEEVSVVKEGEVLEKGAHGRSMSQSESCGEYSSGAESESVKQNLDRQKKPPVLAKSRAPHLPSQG